MDLASKPFCQRNSTQASRCSSVWACQDMSSGSASLLSFCPAVANSAGHVIQVDLFPLGDGGLDGHEGLALLGVRHRHREVVGSGSHLRTGNGSHIVHQEVVVEEAVFVVQTFEHCMHHQNHHFVTPHQVGQETQEWSAVIQEWFDQNFTQEYC